MTSTTSVTLDRSLDEVRYAAFLMICLTILVVCQIISSKKTARRTTRRRTGPRAAVLGTPTVSPTTRARAAAAATSATSNPADKIIVSNLPADVNEVQIKVCESSVTPIESSQY